MYEMGQNVIGAGSNSVGFIEAYNGSMKAIINYLNEHKKEIDELKLRVEKLENEIKGGDEKITNWWHSYTEQDEKDYQKLKAQSYMSNRKFTKKEKALLANLEIKRELYNYNNEYK